MSSEYRYRIEIPQRIWPHLARSKGAGPAHAGSDPCRSDRQPILSTKARSKRVPHPPARSAGEPRHSARVRDMRHDRPSLLSVRRQVQSQAFVRFAVAGCAAIRLSRSTDLRSGTNRPARLSGISPQRCSVNTDQRGLRRCYERNVVAPGGYSKSFFCNYGPSADLF